MGRLHTFVMTLRRESRDINWGLRIVGGADLATPLIVTRVTPSTPAGRELVRGDIIVKIDDYDARDLRHEDAQNLFKNASNQIKLVVQRDADREGPRTGTPMAPRSPISYAAAPPFSTPLPPFSPQYDGEYRTLLLSPSSIRTDDTQDESIGILSTQWRGAESLPRSTPLPPFSPQYDGEYRTLLLSPSSIRTDDTQDESIGILSTQWHGAESLPRSTPLPPFSPQYDGEYRTLLLSPSSIRTDDTQDEFIGILSTQWRGAESLPRSTPLPPFSPQYDCEYRTLLLSPSSIRNDDTQDEMALNPNFFPNGYQDSMHPEEEVVTNWVAESVLQRVVGEEGNKMVHKQFNSPIGLYSDQNIANSIRQQTSPLPHKPTLLYDPALSDTYRALQEDGLGDVAQAVPVPVPVQHKVFTAPTNKRPAPTPKPTKQPDAKSTGKQTTFVNSLQEEHIQQSNSFKRLMYNVLGEY
ncbi:Z band alternatively spliced PDZ-motif protein 66 [Operophtera brumata]|uniref:Z band alternatively spliced PDZ-motif protein 66 n=1 Tax=Operophtera brumata TaxID=104452 RepID=A0A0L7LPB7_OPEBR|nr:Z band alternatively spliced PDZ-motif protein 66 [Operophtera brumata]